MNPTNSLASDAWSVLSKNRAAWFSAIALTTMVLLVLVGPLVSPHEVDQTNWSKLAKPPSMQDGHIFGTDDLGRDLFVRTMYGGRISLMVGIVATLVSVLIGVSYGAISGFVGGKVDSIMMRIVDVLYAMPFLFFVILLMVFFGRSIFLIFVAIGAVNWLDIARIVRGQTLTIKGKEFVDAAKAGGVSTFRIIFRHIVPNLMGIVVVYVALTVPQVILVESFLSFLGLGVQPPVADWGEMVSEGRVVLRKAPHVTLFPGLAILLVSLSFNFVGDGLQRILDPKKY